MIYKIPIAVLAIIVTVIVVFGVAIYGFGVDNDATRSFNSIFPIFPAAIVEGQLITLADIDQRLSMYERAVAFQSKDAAFDRSQIKKEILNSLIEQKIIVDLLSKRKINQMNPSLDEYSEYIIGSFKNNPEQVFGLSDNSFRDLIIESDLASKVLHVALLSESRNSPEYTRVASLKQLLDKGLDFAEAAKDYSEDENSKFLGGDLGFNTRAQLDPWLRGAALALTPSSTSDVVISPDGYHILRLVRRDPGPPERLELQHILIRGFDFNEYLSKQKKNYRIYSFRRD